MKKRILALALAGTTAFSVFGSALSANAWDSTDTRYEVDAYKSYEPVAKSIAVESAGQGTTTTNIIDYNMSTVVSNWKIVSGTPNRQSNEANSIQDYIGYNYDVQEAYEKQTEYNFTPTASENIMTDTGYKPVKVVLYEKGGNKWVRVSKIDSTVPSLGNDYTVVKSWDSTFYVTAADDLGSNIPDSLVYVKGTLSDDDKALFTSANDMGSGFVEYSTQTAVELTVKDGAIVKAHTTDSLYKRIEVVGNRYTYTANNGKKTDYYSLDSLISAISNDYNGAADDIDTEYVRIADHAETGMDTDKNQGAGPIEEEDYKELPIINNYTSKIDTKTTTTPGSGTNSIDVTPSATGYANWTDWTFSTASVEDTVAPYTVKTEVVTDKNLGTYLNTTKVAVPTIYAYDYIYTNQVNASASDIAYAWNSDNTANTVAALGAHDPAMTPEIGRGIIDRGVRYDVVSDWIDFLDTLGINHDGNGYFETEAEFISNYSDMFYSDPVYSWMTGQQIDSIPVDLYNITELLTDIYDMSAQFANAYTGVSHGWNNANTSELVYLMQQYNKYIGNYFDKAEVETSEWGELMLSVLNAATADDFKKSADYKKYMNKVDDLSDAYEEATTVGMIKEAEEGMYSLLTSAPYTAASSADKSELSATLGGLYFNAKSAPGVYSVAPSTADASRATYTNYNYVVAVVDTDAAKNPYNFSTTLKAGYYSLYPMADYIDNDTTTPNSNYNGNVASADFNGKYATEEYEWFWNVYQLAVKMSGTNKYQGAVDAINEALNDAVSNLTVTTTPSSSETAAVADTMEKYAGKIDTDYNEGYYAKYTQANDYAENVAEGKWQTRIAAMITGVSGEALTFQGTQVTVTKNDMKTVETAIKNGETALKAIKEDANYNAAQVTALNKAIAAAEDLVSLYEGTYGTTKSVQSVNKVYTRLVGDKDQMVKSDLTKAIEAIDAAINYSEIVMGWSKNEAGKWQYGTEEGYLSNGWNQVDGGKTWFYFNEDGTAKQSEWWNDNGTWYWFNSNCGAATGWAKVDGEWYYFKGNNAMKTGWEKVDGNWYYMASSGKMVTGWCEIGGKWYYFSKESNSLGQMLYNTTVDGYKLDANGVWVK